MLDNSQEYRLGEPIDYTSCYGYPKVKFQIVRVSDDSVVGHAKQELVPGDDGAVWTKVYYTRDIGRNYGMLRFYASPEALIAGFGGKVSEWHAESMKNAPKGDPVGDSVQERLSALEDKVFAPKPKRKVKLVTEEMVLAAKKRIKKAASRPVKKPALRVKKLA